MSEKPITFSEQEQISIRNLENSGNELTAYKNLLLKSSFKGEDAPSVIGLVNFLDSLLNQTANQLKSITQTASLRTQQPVEALKSEPKLKEVSNGKKTK